VVHVTDDYLDVIFAEAVGGDGEVKFTTPSASPSSSKRSKVTGGHRPPSMKGQPSA
jgi:hypothetical protein